MPTAMASVPIPFALFADVCSRSLGLDGWEPAARDQLVRLQFEAQRQGYRASYPQAISRVIVEDGRPAGWIITDDSGGTLHCVDLAVHPSCRRRGIARRALAQLQAQASAAGRAVTVTVLRGNEAARALYTSLGFRETGATQTHLQLEWRQA